MNYVDHLTDQNQTVHTLIDAGGRASIAPTESTSISSKAYAVEDLLYFEGVLYKVTTAIAQGDSIVTSGSGQNVEVDTIGVDTTKLNRKVSALQKTGCINILDLSSATSQVVEGVTFTVNPDYTITANGTATNNANLIVTLPNERRITVSPSKLKWVGCPAGGSDTTYRMQLNIDSWGYSEYGNGLVLNTSGTIKQVAISVRKGYTANNLVFKPMITPDLSATYDDYQPYSMTNRELTEAVTEIPQMYWEELGHLLNNYGITTKQDSTAAIIDNTSIPKGFYVCQLANGLIEPNDFPQHYGTIFIVLTNNRDYSSILLITIYGTTYSYNRHSNVWKQFTLT